MIIDVFSRKVVSYYISEKNSTQLVKITFKEAYDTHCPEEGLLFHTDNGSNYISNTFMGYLKNLGITQSFSKTHTSYDNSVCESFFANMKREVLYRYKYSSVTDFKKWVGEYIDFYNAKRSHTALQYRTPDKYEADYMHKHGISV